MRILLGATAIFIAVATLLALQQAMAKTERAECATWAKQSKDYPRFFYSDWQAQQCGLK